MTENNQKEKNVEHNPQYGVDTEKTEDTPAINNNMSNFKCPNCGNELINACQTDYFGLVFSCDNCGCNNIPSNIGI